MWVTKTVFGTGYEMLRGGSKLRIYMQTLWIDASTTQNVYSAQ